MRTTPRRRPPALRPGLWGALVLGLLVAGLLTAGSVRGAVSAQPAAAVRPGGGPTTPQPPRPTPTPTRLPASCELGPQPTPMVPQATGTPTPTVANPLQWHTGVYAQASGQYLLKRRGDLVSAVLATRAAPLPPPPVLFTVPAAYRPPSLLWRDVVGHVVRADGTPDPAYPEPFPFRLWLHPDGTIRQALEAGPAGEERYLAYELAVTWGTTPAANDHAVLALLDERWFGTSVLSQMPYPSPGWAKHKVSFPAHPYWTRPGTRTGTVYTWMAFDDSLRVTRLHVREMAPVAPLPSELAQFDQLEELLLGGIEVDYDTETRQGRLARNEPLPPGLTGPIPPELGLLTRLQRLVLYNHQLTGPIPPTLGNLNRLQELVLSNNLLSGAVPSELGSLSHLRRLFLHENWLAALPPELGRLDCLQYLYLPRNLLTALPPELGRLTNLIGLSVEYNQLTTLPPELGRLATLQQLDLHGNRLYELPPELGQLAQLQHLDLARNRLTTLPPELGSLTHLRQLYLHDNRLTSLPPELGQLQALTKLNLSGNPIATIPPELGPLAQLDWESFSISGAPLTGCLPAAWLNRWPFLANYYANRQLIERQLPACPETEPTDRNQKDDVGKSDTGLG